MTMFETLIQFFQDEEWPFTQIEDSPALKLPFKGKNGEWACYTQAADGQFIFHSVLPILVPEKLRPAMAEFITRANYGMNIGNFEMDFEDGEIRYKTGITLEDEGLTQSMIRPQVYANVIMMDRYLPAMLDVIYGGVKPKDAVEAAEAAAQEST